MIASTPNWTKAVFAASFFCVVSWKYSVFGVKDGLLFAGRSLLFLSFFTWTWSCLYPRLKAALSSNSPDPIENPEDENTRREVLLARKKQQEKHSHKMSFYQESILKPRQEATQKRKEELLASKTCESWTLTKGHRVGGEPQQRDMEMEEEGLSPNQEALRRRRLPESATRVQPRPQPPVEKKVIVLPEEPADDAEGVVRVAIRCPSGRTLHRRFLKSHSSACLLQWMQKAGYHPTLYTLCTSYPRRPLVTAADMSMDEAGIITHTVLNIEEKDPSET